MKTIQLTQARHARIDDEDFELVSEFRWCAKRMKRPGLWYAIRREGRQYIYMHRLIMDISGEYAIPPGYVVDHLDGDGLNNQADNLEVVLSIENTRRYHRKLQHLGDDGP